MFSLGELVSNPSKKIWAMGGGKGGIGKSFVISNLAISLAKQGKNVVIVDLDLGSANLHTCLGCDIPELTISDFLSGRVDSLEKLLVKTSVSRLSMVSGASDALSISDLKKEQHQALLDQLKSLNCDYLFLDLGAGTHENTLDYFLLADRPIVGFTPEPTSIENAYRFIKSSFFRWILHAEKRLGAKAIVDQVMDQKNSLGIKSPSDLIKKITELNPELGESFKKEIENFKIFLLLNQVRTLSDTEIGESVKNVCKKYFGIDTQYVGHLDYDNTVWQSVRKHKPLVLEYPHSQLVNEFNGIVKKLCEEDERLSSTKLLRTA